MNAEPETRPVAIVLGAAVWAGGVPSPTLRRRAEKGATLWHDGRVRAVLATGGVGVHGPSEAAVIAAVCRAAGVPEDALLTEDRSTTTEENLRNALPALQALGVRDVLIVTDFWHAPRAGLVARRLGLRPRLAPVSLRGARLKPAIKGILREVPACLWYWLRGAGRG